jgi:hypothetical protein
MTYSGENPITFIMIGDNDDADDKSTKPPLKALQVQ